MMDSDEDEVYRFFATPNGRRPYDRQDDDDTPARKQ